MKLLLFSSVAALSDVDKLGIIGDYHVRSSHTRWLLPHARGI